MRQGPKISISRPLQATTGLHVDWEAGHAKGITWGGWCATCQPVTREEHFSNINPLHIAL